MPYVGYSGQNPNEVKYINEREEAKHRKDAKNAAECCSCSTGESIAYLICGGIVAVIVLCAIYIPRGSKKPETIGNSTTPEISNYTFSSTTALDQQAEIFNSTVSTVFNMTSSAALKIFNAITGNSTGQN